MAARTISESVTLHFCNHFSFISIHYACKLHSNYPGIKFVSAVWRQEEKNKICRHVLTLSISIPNKSFLVVDRTRTAAKWTKKKIPRGKRTKFLFFRRYLQICDVVIAVVVACRRPFPLRKKKNSSLGERKAPRWLGVKKTKQNKKNKTKQKTKQKKTMGLQWSPDRLY